MAQERAHAVQPADPDLPPEAPPVLVARACREAAPIPIYAGTSSTAQRWRKPTGHRRMVLRDALYWVLLLMITLGVRPKRILQLKLRNVRLREALLRNS